MELAAAILAVALLGQTTQPGLNKAAPPARPTTGAVARPTPHDFVAETVRLPAAATGKYQDVTLSDVLAAAPQHPAQRLAVVHAYWRLWRAFAEESIAQSQLAKVQSLSKIIQPMEVEKTLIAAESASAKAKLEECKLGIKSAQTELCSLLGWAVSATLPRPFDPPHVGTYDTKFNQIYAVRTPTERAMLIHQTLPIYHYALGAHGTARQAVDDVVVAEEEGLRQQQIPLETMLLAWRSQATRQSELCRVALEYNNLIAEYAVPLAGSRGDTATLVSYLLRQPAKTAARGRNQAEVGRNSDDISPANYQEDFSTDPSDNREPATLDQEDFEEGTIPDTIDEAPLTSDGALNWPANSVDASENPDARDGSDVEADAPGELPRAEEPGYPGEDAVPAGEPAENPFDANGVSTRGAPRRYRAAKVPVAPRATAIFAGFTAGSATPRAVMEKMFDRTHVGNQGEQSLSLAKCLAGVSPTLYPAVAEAYVNAWQAAAHYQADVDALAQIQAAEDALLTRLTEASAPRDMLVLRAAETQYSARMIERELEIWLAAKQLGALALPRTVGAMVLPYDDAPVWASASKAATEPSLLASAQALVEQDAARAKAALDAPAAQLSGLTLYAIERQNEETLRFVDRAADAARGNGRAVLAQLGSQVNAATARAALLGQNTTQATRPSSQYRNRVPTP